MASVHTGSLEEHEDLEKDCDKCHYVHFFVKGYGNGNTLQKHDLKMIIKKYIPGYSDKSDNYYKKKNIISLKKIITEYIEQIWSKRVGYKVTINLYPDEEYLSIHPDEELSMLKLVREELMNSNENKSESSMELVVKEELPTYRSKYDELFCEKGLLNDKLSILGYNSLITQNNANYRFKFDIYKDEIKDHTFDIVLANCAKMGFTDTTLYFHGTDKKWTSFCPYSRIKNGNAYGNGLYVTKDINRAYNYTGRDDKFIILIVAVNVKLEIGDQYKNPTTYDRFVHYVDDLEEPRIYNLHNPELYRVIGVLSITNEFKSLRLVNKLTELPFRLRILWYKYPVNSREEFEHTINTNEQCWKQMGILNNEYPIRSKLNHIFCIVYDFDNAFIDTSFSSTKRCPLQYFQVTDEPKQIINIDGRTHELKFPN